VGHSRGSNRLKLYNGHGNVEATKALFAGCRGKQVKNFVPISLSIAIELSTTNITKLSNYVQSVQVLWSQPSSSLANESKFPEHSGKLKMLIKSCLSVVLTSTVYWLSNVSAKMGCSRLRSKQAGYINCLLMTLTTAKRFTIEEYHRLAELGFFHEDDRIELIRGEIMQMAAKVRPIQPVAEIYWRH
jgi:hypothetical protein